MDWTGNKPSIFVTNGCTSHSTGEREENDYYATEPRAVELLLEQEKFNNNIWECACGEGHISKVLKDKGYNVISTDLIFRGYGDWKPYDFLKCNAKNQDLDIITNPPYKNAKEFVEKALETIKTGNKVAMFLKLTFLEGQARKRLFEENPPKIVYVASGRLNCAKNGEFEKYKSSAVAYAWYIWEKGYRGKTVVEWIN